MPPLSIMIKPASDICNMKCRYCFYHDVTDHREIANFGIMNNETADNIIEKALSFADGNSVAFAFQGGEPLFAGIEFFENFVKSVRDKNIKGSTIYFSLQTNGTRVTKEWAEFFKRNDFLIGLSLDGDFKRNKFRVDNENKNTYYKILDCAQLLKEYEVEFNILTVLTGMCADNIDVIYKFFREKGFKYLQFIPCLRPFGSGEEGELYMTENQYTNFLIKTFNYYVKDYVRGNYTSIRYFDNLVRLYRGDTPEQCGMCGHCLHQFVAEANGNIYPCDFYCTDEWLLGNINSQNFDELAHTERATEFLRESLHIEDKCRACKYYPLCRGGGCKRTRTDRDYCESYKKFFSACLPLFRVFK